MLSYGSIVLDASIYHMSVPSKIGVEIASHLRKLESYRIRGFGIVLSFLGKGEDVPQGKHPQYVQLYKCEPNDFLGDYQEKPRYHCFPDKFLGNLGTDMDYAGMKYSIFHVYIPNLGEG